MLIDTARLKITFHIHVHFDETRRFRLKPSICYAYRLPFVIAKQKKIPQKEIMLRVKYSPVWHMTLILFGNAFYKYKNVYFSYLQQYVWIKLYFFVLFPHMNVWNEYKWFIEYFQNWQFYLQLRKQSNINILAFFLLFYRYHVERFNFIWHVFEGKHFILRFNQNKYAGENRDRERNW